jgi:hypothetical protein
MPARTWPNALPSPLLPLPAQGVITHVTDVKPLASVITYTDEEGGTELYQEVLGR